MGQHCTDEAARRRGQRQTTRFALTELIMPEVPVAFPTASMASFCESVKPERSISTCIWLWNKHKHVRLQSRVCLQRCLNDWRYLQGVPDEVGNCVLCPVRPNLRSQYHRS